MAFGKVEGIAKTLTFLEYKAFELFVGCDYNKMLGGAGPELAYRSIGFLFISLENP